MNKSTLQKTAFFFEMVVLFTMFGLKMIYYIKKYKSGYFSGYVTFEVWSFISILITCIPIILLLIVNRSAFEGHESYEKHAVLSAFYLIFAIFNILFEGVSIVSGTISMDSSRTNLAVQILACHLLTFIPFVMLILAEKRENPDQSPA